MSATPSPACALRGIPRASVRRSDRLCVAYMQPRGCRRPAAKSEPARRAAAVAAAGGSSSNNGTEQPNEVYVPIAELQDLCNRSLAGLGYDEREAAVLSEVSVMRCAVAARRARGDN